MDPGPIIQLFDDYLAQHGEQFEATCIGGSALSLLGVITRETQDCDILVPTIPPRVKELSVEFAKFSFQSGTPLKSDWLNNGPASLGRDVPTGWEKNSQILFEGRAIKFVTLSRTDLIRSKLYALCDRAINRADCLALAPTRDELSEILPWLEERDGNPLRPNHVRDTVAELAKTLVYEL